METYFCACGATNTLPPLVVGHRFLCHGCGRINEMMALGFEQHLGTLPTIEIPVEAGDVLHPRVKKPWFAVGPA